MIWIKHSYSYDVYSQILYKLIHEFEMDTVSSTT